MGKSVTREIAGVGKVLFEYSSKLKKRILIYNRPFKGIRVAIPRGVPLKRAEDFVNDNIDKLVESSKERRESERRHIDAFKELKEIDIETGLKRIALRFYELAEKHGFKYRSLTFRNQRTRWGTCSSRGDISLNIQMVRLTDELIDYLILHELLHTKIKDHSEEFYAELNGLVGGDSRAIRKKLGGYKMGYAGQPSRGPVIPAETLFSNDSEATEPIASDKRHTPEQLEMF